jgi:hypothetical protein
VIRRRFLREPRRGDIIRGDVLVPKGPPPRSTVILGHDFEARREDLDVTAAERAVRHFAGRLGSTGLRQKHG